MANHVKEEATISIPSLLFVGILLFFSYRYFFSSPDASGASSSSRTNGLRFTAAQVEQVAAMFPQLNRRDIMWDLHRNRGSVQATTERVLMGRGLDPVRCLARNYPLTPKAQTTDAQIRTGAAVVSAADHVRGGEFNPYRLE